MALPAMRPKRSHAFAHGWLLSLAVLGKSVNGYLQFPGEPSGEAFLVFKIAQTFRRKSSSLGWLGSLLGRQKS